MHGNEPNTNLKDSSCYVQLTSNNQLMKKMNWFVKIKLYSNESIEWHCIQIQFNSDLIELNSKCNPNKWNGIQTQLKKNRMHGGLKGIEN